MVALKYLITGVLSTVVAAKYSNDTSAVSSSIASTISSSSSLSESSSLSQLSSSDIPVLPSSSSIDYSSVADNSTTSDISAVTSSEIPSHTSSSNSSSVTFSSTSTSDISTSTPSAAIENVQVFDTLTQSQISSNPNNWFVINVDISVTAGFTGDLFLTVPDQFSNFPEGNYDVLANEDVIGSVSHNSSGVFKVSFEDVAEDYYGSFNFLTKLADKPSEPITVDYSFDVYSGPTFSSTLTFETKSYTVSTVDTGIDEYGRPYFAVDIPYNEYPGELEFTSVAESDYKFVASYFQIVTAVDSFKNPTAASNVTAAKSNSDESTISYSFSSSVSGGQALRIIYFLSADDGITTLKNVAQLTYPNLSVYKRDISVIFDTTAYLEPVSNIELSGINSITVLTSNVDNNNGTSTSIPTSTITSTNITSSIPTVTSVSTYSNESLTYTVITRTQDGEVTEITQLVPVSTLSSSFTSSASSEDTTSTERISSATSESSHSKSLASSSSSSKENSSTISKDSDSKSMTSYAPTEEASSTRSKDSQSTSLTSSSYAPTEEASSTRSKDSQSTSLTSSSYAPTEETSSSKPRDTSSKSTSNSSEDIPLSYATVVTETVHGRTSTYTSWVSSCTACQKTGTLEITSPTETAVRTDTPSSEKTNFLTFTNLESRTINGEETEIGSFVPVTTLATDVGNAAEKTQTSLTTSTRGAEVSTLLQFLGASTSSDDQTQVVVSQYSGFANRVEYGFGSLFIAILAIMI